MSRQQSRPSGDGAIDPSLVQKKRARHRLVGAICLCILAAIIVPLVLESEPRPRDHELPIELAVPARDDAAAPDAHADAATHAPGTPAATAPLASAGNAANAGRPGGAIASGQIGNLGGQDRGPGAAAPPPQAPDASAESRSAVKTVTPGVGVEASKAEPPRAESASQAARQEAARQAAARQDAAKQDSAKQDSAKQGSASASEAAKTADAAKAAKAAEAKAAPAKPPLAPEKPAARKDEPDVLARLIERADDGAAAGKAASRRFLVQIGAYSNVQSAKTASDRAVQLGLRPFQETVKTAQGDWIRVRIGPFSTRQDAERAQQDLKRAGVTAAIIAL